MEKDEQSMLCSIGLLQTETSLALVLPQSRSQGRRFRRSNSGQRSRSKENHRANENPSFFVRNCFTEEATVTPPPKDTTPQKSSRRNNHIRGKDEQSQKESDAQRMAKMCEGLNELLQKSNSYILQLQGRIGELEQELRAKAGSAGERARQKENRGNLAKLRKQIAQTRNVEAVPPQALRQLQAQNFCLKQEVQSLKANIRKKEEQFQSASSQREAQLQALILQLRQCLKASQKREGQLQMQVDRLRLRQRKQSENVQQAKSEELSYLRFRYQRIRNKFQENKKQLQVFQRRAASRGYLFAGGEGEQVSLSLSP